MHSFGRIVYFRANIPCNISYLLLIHCHEKKYEKKYEASLVLESKKIHHSSRCIAIMMDGKKKVYAIPIHRMAHLKWRNERSS